MSVVEESVTLRHQAEGLRAEFLALEEQWRKDTQQSSLISMKVLHGSYFRIIGMGKAAVPLLLESLRDRPAHWFVALEATTNANPVPAEANASAARDVWLRWGRDQGLID